MLRLILLAQLIFYSSLIQGQIRLKEDFSSAKGYTPPAGWQSISVKGSSIDKWSYDDPYAVSPLASASAGNFATFSGFFYSDDGTEEDVELISPSFNCSTDQTITLFFYEYYYQDKNSGGAQVLISSDNGMTWLKIYEPSEKESPSVPVMRKVDISAIAGKGNVQLKFRAFGNGSVVWIIDDVNVISGPIAPPVISHDVYSSTCGNGQFLISASVKSEYGISSARIHYKVNEGEKQTIEMTKGTGDIYSGSTSQLSGNGKIEYVIEAIDGSINRNSSFDTGNASKWNKFYFGSINTTDYKLDFYDDQVNYEIWNEDSILSWHLINRESSVAEDSMISLNFYDTREKGLKATFQTIPFSVDGHHNIFLYDVAYAPYEYSYDTLALTLSTDGGRSWLPLQKRTGRKLATTDAVNPPFVPAKDDWRTEFIDLSEYQGSCVILAFTGISNDGNNLYIDNIRFDIIPQSELYVSQNYPNPVSNGKTKIDIKVPDLKPSELVIYDLLGRVKFQQPLDPAYDTFTMEIDITLYPSGYYLVSVISDTESITKKMLVN